MTSSENESSGMIPEASDVTSDATPSRTDAWGRPVAPRRRVSVLQRMRRSTAGPARTQTGPASKPAAAADKTAKVRRKRKLPASIVVVLALMGTGLLWAALAPSGNAADAAASSEQIRQGRALFLSGCSSCHGLEAQGGNQAPSLIGVGSAAVDFQVGTGRMPLAQPGAQAERKDPKYTQTQIDQLAAYIASLAPGPAVPADTVLTDGAIISEGGALYRTNCAQCHQAIGQGGALSYGKHAPALGDATKKQIYEAVRTGPENMPVFGSGQLSDTQVASIIKYVQFVTHPNDPGGDSIGHYGPVPEGLVAIIIGLGGLVIATLWIGSRFSS
jgi:ubiquinol-cytochrome c reductase cytochrome c subunit